MVNTPSVAVSRKADQPGHTDILQAVLVDQESGDGEALLVTLRMSLSNIKPPQVVQKAVEVMPINLADRNHQCDIAELLEEWWTEYKVREMTKAVDGAPKSWAWFGDPNTGFRDVPPDWEASVRRLGSILGIQTYIAKSQHEARAQALHERADIALQLYGARRWDEMERLLTEEDKGLLSVGDPGTSFSELLRVVRQLIIPAVIEPDGFADSSMRELSPGEYIFHRKIRNGRHFDYFDHGSLEPCSHGKDAFEVWRTAEKAAKGMARRYSNFTDGDVQLRHCSHYPNCGMYAVYRRPKSE